MDAKRSLSSNAPARRRRALTATVAGLAALAGTLATAGSAAAADIAPIVWQAGGQSAGTGTAGQSYRVTSDASGNVTVLSGGSQTEAATVTSYTSTGQLRWRRTILAPSGHYVSRTVEAAPNGDVVVAVTNFPNSSSTVPLGSAVVRFSGTGTELWRAVHAGSFVDYRRMVLDAAGNAYVVFSFNGTSVRKYGTGGALLWEDAGGVGASASSIALSPDGLDVVATSTTAANWIVIARDTATGAKRWTVNAPIGTAAADVVVDAAAVYVTGTGNIGIDRYLTVVAFDRSTGVQRWRTNERPAGATSAAGLRMQLTPTGELVVAGQAGFGFLDWYTAGFSTAGVTRWETVRNGGLNTDEIPADVEVLADGTTVVTGVGGPALPGGFIQGITAGYSATGALLWEGFTPFATHWAEAVPNGDVCVVGGYDGYVACLDPVAGGGGGGPVPAVRLSSTTGGSVGGVTFADEDVVSVDPATGAWTMWFDGSDVGLGAADVDAFEMLPDGRMLLSTEAPVTIAGIRYDDSDVIAFTPTSTGSTTAGSFAAFATGASLGLTTDAEDVDAIAFDTDGSLVLSTTGRLSARGVAAEDEDLTRFSGTTAALVLDGSAIGLTASTEDVAAASLRADRTVAFGTTGAFTLTGGLTGTAGTVGQCAPGAGTVITSCASTSLLAPSALAPFAGEAIDAVGVTG